MKSVNDYEKEVWDKLYEHSKKDGTGVACPSCGEELVESSSEVLLFSDPPRKNVHCNLCKSKYTLPV